MPPKAPAKTSPKKNSGKSVWLSKTFWFSIVTVTVGTLGLVLENGIITNEPVANGVIAVVGALNLALRFLTKEPVSITKD